ncbi:unnamed protein product [Paramecium sonneborni]|uniref:Uncharacterized protein n=1 Tax=Paramecium sonneborni TaxID=65129 RepID=A0A8S1LCT9_9CILI|nr:unnamed protein product [Paramecium sonneborni]
MEYCQHCIYIYQANSPDQQKIIDFEKYETIIQHDDYYLLVFPQNLYISLQSLIDSIRNQYILIYIGQAIIIINRILKHLKILLDVKKFNHGNLNNQNIFIFLRSTSQQFNIIQSKIEIEKIHFINYSKYCPLNRKIDIQNIKKAILDLLQNYEKNSEISNLITKISQKESIIDFIEIIQKFQAENVDVDKQQLMFDDLKTKQRRHKLHKLKDYHHQFYQFWKIDPFYDYKDKNQNQIIEMMKNLLLIDQLKNFQSSVRILLENLEDPLEQIRLCSQKYNKRLGECMEKIQIRVENQYQKMLQQQKKVKQNFNLQVQIISQSKIASIFYSLLYKNVLRTASFELNRLFETAEQVEKELIKELENYLNLEIKIAILSVISEDFT